MHLFIDGLENRNGYFQMPFEAPTLIGEEDGKLIIIGNDLKANFEIATMPTESGKYVIFQTPEDFMYNTLGYIAKFQFTNVENGVNAFFSKNDLDKIEVLGVNISFLEKSHKIIKTYILKINLEGKDDKVCFFENSNLQKTIAYTFTKDCVKKSQLDIFDSNMYVSVDNIKFLKMEKECEKISASID